MHPILHTALTISTYFVFVEASPALPSLSEGNHSTTVNATHLVESQDLSSPFPYEFPFLGNVSELDAARFPMPQCTGLTLEEATIDQLQDFMRSGQLSSAQIAMCYLQRIYQVDPYIKYVVECSGHYPF